MTTPPLLTRNQACEYLTKSGHAMKVSTLATIASRGGGPKFMLFGRKPLYRPEDLDEWVAARSTGFGTTTKELKVDPNYVGLDL